MLASKAFTLIITIFALLSFYAIFHSLYQTQLKFDDTSDLHPIQNNNASWFKPKVKVVMVFIDSFRFDYLLNFKNIDHDPALKHNKLTRFNMAFHNHPDRFVVFRALADTPTMTTLRIPSLMTGNIPKMGDILNAFGASPAEEDSIPRQLYRQNRTSYFTGNPLIKEFFPKYFEFDQNVTHLNMTDWRVDEASHNFTNQKLEENNFDFLAAHLERLDHMGHHWGLDSSRVFHAIEDVDRFLVNIMRNIDDHTMLLFAGDHGMTKSGTHGDGSAQETDTAIVAYYKKGFMKYKHRKNGQIEAIMKSIHETDDQIHQKDLAPTLAMLMGLPIPFSSMGQILNDLYPNGNYLPRKQRCPDAAFFMQMLADNHLNTLQVWNYFKQYHEKQPGLFNETEYQDLADTYEDLVADYQHAYAMIDLHQQCDHSFQKTVSNTIKESQQLSHTIYDLVKSRPARDLVIFWQAVATLAVITISYIFIAQYIYKNKDYEHTIWRSLKNWKATLKYLIPLAIILASTWIYMQNHILMRKITTLTLVSALWTLLTLGIKVFSFRSSKKSQKEVSFEMIPSIDASTEVTVIAEEVQPKASPSALISSQKSFFIFQNPLIFVAAVTLIGGFFYCLTHQPHLLDKLDIPKDYISYIPYIFVLLAGVRLAFRYPHRYVPILLAALLLSAALNFTKNHAFWSKKGYINMGLLLVADWVWDEIQFTRFKLRAGKAWSYQYAVCFVVLALYHREYHIDSESITNTEFNQIVLPQIFWGLLTGSCLASFAWRMPRKVIKRNMQVNIVLFLVFMQFHKKLLFFGIVLSLMRFFNSFFNKAQFKNYLYPLCLGLVSYIGLFAIGFSDQKLPRSFEGFDNFSFGVSIFLYGSAMLSTVILGMLFMSFHSQDLEHQEVELGVQREESECQVIALKGDLKIIKKRNALFYCLFYCLVMICAAIHQVTLKSHKKAYLSMERFLIDGAIYFFVTNVLTILL